MRKLKYRDMKNKNDKTKTLFHQGGFIMKTKTNKMIAVVISLLMILNISFILKVEMFKETKVHSETISFDDKVINELIKLETRINVSEYKLTTAEAMAKFWQVISDNPRLFFVKLVNNTIACSYFLDENGNKNANNLILTYEADVTLEKVQEQLNQFDLEASKILSKVKPEMKDYEKVMIVHDYMVLSYGYDIYTGGITAYDMIVNKIGVCQAYASAFKHFMDTLGIESTIVTSGAMNHAWNMVKIDGEWYHVDITWDDPMPDLVGRINHNYLLLSDEKMIASNYHSWDAKYQATSTKYDNFFWRNVNSEIYIEENNWYYLNSKGSFEVYNSQTQQTNVNIYIHVEMWPYWDENTGMGSSTTFWMGNYSSVIVHAGKMYYNTPTHIYQLNLDGSNQQGLLYVNPQLDHGYAYGLKVENNVLYCCIKKDYTSEARFIKVIDLPEGETYIISKDWDNIYDSINNSTNGQIISVDNQNYKLPQAILDALKGKNVTLDIHLGKYSWIINGAQVINSIGEFNMEISTNLGLVPKSKIDQMTYGTQVLELNLKHDGEFGFDATIEYYVGTENVGKVVSIYYYNKTLDRMEKIGSSNVSTNGEAQMNINHASSYVMIIGEKEINKGDLNIDGKIDNMDLVLMCQYMIKDRELQGQALLNADINSDGLIMINDLAYLRQHIMGDFVTLNNIF